MFVIEGRGQSHTLLMLSESVYMNSARRNFIRKCFFHAILTKHISECSASSVADVFFPKTSSTMLFVLIKCFCPAFFFSLFLGRLCGFIQSKPGAALDDPWPTGRVKGSARTPLPIHVSLTQTHFVHMSVFGFNFCYCFTHGSKVPTTT